ncbi:MAG: hypothetical protein HXY34_12225 [Candidatus Thorarchaeota archaeon]|nr:hypothetical protein [Candidatus Thorarchaeota archaeon]
MSGVTSIIETINRKTEERAEKIINEAQIVKDQLLREAMEKAGRLKVSMTTKAETDAKAQLAKYEASTRLKSKHRILEAKEEIVGEVVAAVMEKARKTLEGAEGKEALTRLVVEAAVALDAQELELVIPDGSSREVDVASLKKAIKEKTGRPVSLEIASETVRSSGGVVIRTVDKRKSVDNTLEARMDRLAGEVREAVTRALFQDS